MPFHVVINLLDDDNNVIATEETDVGKARVARPIQIVLSNMERENIQFEWKKAVITVERVPNA